MAESPNLEGGGIVKLSVYSGGASIDENYKVVSVSVSKGVNRIPTARIVLLDGDMAEQDFPVSNSDDFKPGAEIKINAGYGHDEETIFSGIVIRHGIKVTGANYSRLVVECRDKAVGLTVGRKNANFLDSTDGAIIAKLIGSGGLASDVASTTTTHKELVQYYCTDWDFLLSRAEVNGLLVTVEEGKVRVQPPKTSGEAALKVSYGVDLMEFHADMDARDQLTEVAGVAWDMKTGAAVEEKVTPKALNAQGDIDSKALARVVGLASYRLQTPVPLEKTALKAWAEARQLKAGLARIRGRMKFQGSSKAKIGELMELEGVGKRFAGNVFVSSIGHEIAEGGWTTEVEFGMAPEWFAERRDLVAPPASGLLPGIEGLQIGVVKKIDADPETQYRVQVSVPVLKAETEGVWARLAVLYAGVYFVPEIGDEVVLGYFNNDPSHPVILGVLHSSKSKPPYEMTGENYAKAIVTKGGLRVEFDDEKKVITLLTPGKNTIVIDDEGKSILLQDQNKNKVELSSSGIVLESAKDIKISAKGKVTIDAVGELGISSKADVKVAGLNIENKANVGFTAKGNASAELSASGQTTVKGAMVMIN